MRRASTIFQKKKAVPFLALAAAFSWGCAFPLIKLGFDAFAIAANDTGGKTLFAGIRFLAAGLLTLLVAAFSKRSFRIGSGKNAAWLLLLGVVNTALHYFFFYIGLSYTSGAKTSILDALGTFLLVIFACVCFRDEHLTARKLIGCVLGFAGIVLLNIGGEQGRFSPAGDGMILLSAVCAALGGAVTRVVTRKTDALVATGISLSVGGALLLPAGWLLGGSIPQFTPRGGLILLLLILVSTVGFSLYNQLLRHHPVSEVAIYNAWIPAFGAVLSCLLLGEPFLWQYLPAAALITVGILVANTARRPTERDNP